MACVTSRSAGYCYGIGPAWRRQSLVNSPISPFPKTISPEAAAAGNSGPADRAAVAAAAPLAACEGCCGASAVCATTGAGTGSGAVTAVLGVPASVFFSLSSGLMVPIYGLMAFFPKLRLTRDLFFNNGGLYIGLSLLYAATLLRAWQAGLGAALAGVVVSVQSAAGHGLAAIDLSPISLLFSNPLVTLMSWLHLLVLDALMAREIALDGIRTNTPTAHSVLLCFFFGPTGLLSHALTRLVRGKASS